MTPYVQIAKLLLLLPVLVQSGCASCDHGRSIPDDLPWLFEVKAIEATSLDATVFLTITNKTGVDSRVSAFSLDCAAQQLRLADLEGRPLLAGPSHATRDPLPWRLDYIAIAAGASLSIEAEVKPLSPEACRVYSSRRVLLVLDDAELSELTPDGFRSFHIHWQGEVPVRHGLPRDD
jgi:hypothetical protein